MTRGRTDSSQALIIQALRRAGAKVQDLSQIGRGCPDLLCSFVDRRPGPTFGLGVNLLMEVKDGMKAPSHRRLTTQEAAWHEHWLGPVIVVASVREALEAIGATEASDVR